MPVYQIDAEDPSSTICGIFASANHISTKIIFIVENPEFFPSKSQGPGDLSQSELYTLIQKSNCEAAYLANFQFKKQYRFEYAAKWSYLKMTCKMNFKSNLFRIPHRRPY